MEKNEKKEYVKPRLRTIELAAEEVLITGCKLASSGTAPYLGCPDTYCAAVGS